jgi:integral membrane protein (TIGR00529 family)
LEGVKLLIVFAVLMTLLLCRVPFSRVMLGCSVLLALFFSTGIKEYLVMVGKGLTNWVTIEMVLIVTSVMVLEHFLSKNGYLDGMLASLQGVIKNPTAVMAVLPAFIGLMPSAGGALFSAPLVEQIASGNDVTPEQKSFVNFYFRHTSEYFLPIYPGVILTAGLSGIPIRHLIFALAPYGLLVILLGLPSLRKISLPKIDRGVPDNYPEMLKTLGKNILPIFFILFFVLFLGMEVALSVSIVLVALLIYHKYSPAKIWNLLREAINKKTILMVFSVMIFKQVLTDTNAVNGLPPLLDKLPVPEVIILCLVTFFVGMLTGMMVAVIGISFPIAMAGMGGDLSLTLVVLLFISGFAGTMISPMHLCLPITVDYFQADLKRVLRMLIVPEIALWATAFSCYLIF